MEVRERRGTVEGQRGGGGLRGAARVCPGAAQHLSRSQRRQMQDGERVPRGTAATVAARNRWVSQSYVCMHLRSKRADGKKPEEKSKDTTVAAKKELAKNWY